ncbi:MAG: hypothetical protein SFV32_12850 [Opitutaceae bacterium]|nr:hypothetical protein [Opitutaceae bacterium]
MKTNLVVEERCGAKVLRIPDLEETSPKTVVDYRRVFFYMIGSLSVAAIDEVGNPRPVQPEDLIRIVERSQTAGIVHNAA